MENSVLNDPDLLAEELAEIIPFNMTLDLEIEPSQTEICDPLEAAASTFPIFSAVVGLILLIGLLAFAVRFEQKLYILFSP